ncbi:zinc ABC transporter substrate-binding protein [Pusillimonas sp. SM2304]|uniref:metal ABC transporter solute-binding protein, Zn/Mn family n=1 Tax=Pusillimonas sp. SM2304 TaxID=3073241 RepID=UPI002874FD86|nr:zinc ABC transporter substrate-binding protein [Pusillimonas sp. SM2304]MDS1142315.1 zinc ABC transporter substrate-binding protein [Pusillimonas sp. SM2304]
MPKPTVSAAAAAASAAILLCLTAPVAAAKDLNVVATFSIIGDLARNVGGERIALTTLVGPDGDTHVYEPRPADVAAVGAADVVLSNGLHLEGFLDRLLKASGTKATVAELAQGGDLLRNTQEEHAHGRKEDHGHSHGHEDDHKHDHDDDHKHDHEHDHKHDHEHGHHHGEYDPHAWQSVNNARVYVANIAKAFCAADTKGCAAYQSNAAAYDKQLQALDTQIRTAMAAIPADRRTIMTSHDAFGYFAREYGLRFLAPQSMTTGAEPSAAAIAALIRQIQEQHVSAIFVENISNARLTGQIAQETGLKLSGSLYSDALSAENGPAASYIDMMRHNAMTIQQAILGRE